MELFAHVVAAALITNSLPHLAHGLGGYAFPTPFAKPPAVGLSRPETNVAWGALNLGVGTALLFGVGNFRLGANVDTAVIAITAAVIGLAVSRSSARARRRREASDR